MINHVNPLYSVAAIMSVAVVALILVGFVLVDWELVRRDLRRFFAKVTDKFSVINDSDDEPFDASWMDAEAWQKTRIRK